MPSMTPQETKEHIEYIFIDESGDLGVKGSVCFTIVALGTHEREKLGRIMKRLRQRKLKKKFKELPEIKGGNSSEEVRRFVLSRVAVLSCSISAIVIRKSILKKRLFENKNRLYGQLCGLLMEQISLRADVIDITVDRRSIGRILRDDFDQYVRSRILDRRPDAKVLIQHTASDTCNELQVTDFVVWAVNRKYSGGEDSYYDIIKSRIANAGREEIRDFEGIE